MPNLLFRATALLAAAAWLVPGPCLGAGEARWSVNSWGATPTVTRTDPASADCSDAAGSPKGLRFQMIERRPGGDAELVLSSAALQPGQAYLFTVRLKSLEGKVDADLFFRRNEFAYETAVVHTLALTPEWTTVKLRGVYTPDSAGAVRLSLRGTKGGVCVGNSSLQEIPSDQVGPPPAAEPIKPRFFGVHINRLGVHRSWPSFDPGLVRLWDTGTTWALLEPEPGPIEWATNAHAKRLEFYVQYVRRNNPDADILMTIGMTPKWAGPEHPNNCNNSGYGPRSCTAPTDLAAWRRHVRELATHYKGVIRHWEVWNESDVWVHWNAGAQKLYEVVKAASEELKAVDPANVVIGPNVTGSGLRFLNDFLNAGGGRVIDGISVHFYFGRSPQTAENAVRNLREMLADRKLNLSIWNTETGVSCITQTECKLVRSGGPVLDSMSALARGLIGQAAMGVVNTNYYTWEGAGSRYGGPALVEEDFRTPTPEGRLYELLSQWMTGAVVKPLAGTPQDVEVVTITREGRTAYAVWSTDASAKLKRSLVPGVNRVQATDGSKPESLPDGDIHLSPRPQLLYAAPSASAGGTP